MKIKFAKLMSAVAASRRGATAIEYGLIAALVGLVIAGGATALGTDISTKFTNIGGCVAAGGAGAACQ